MGLGREGEVGEVSVTAPSGTSSEQTTGNTHLAPMVISNTHTLAALRPDFNVTKVWVFLLAA